MRRVISEVGQLIGITVAIGGIIVGMCDTADLESQVRTMFIGLAMFLIGAGITALAKMGEEYVG